MHKRCMSWYLSNVMIYGYTRSGIVLVREIVDGEYERNFKNGPVQMSAKHSVMYLTLLPHCMLY